MLYFNVKFNDRDNEILEKTTSDLVDVAHKCGGTHYLPYQLFYTREQLAKSYSRHRRLLRGEEAPRSYRPLHEYFLRKIQSRQRDSAAIGHSHNTKGSPHPPSRAPFVCGGAVRRRTNYGTYSHTSLGIGRSACSRSRSRRTSKAARFRLRAMTTEIGARPECLSPLQRPSCRNSHPRSTFAARSSRSTGPTRCCTSTNH